MLTARENFRRCITGDGKPDRFVNNYEALSLAKHLVMLHDSNPVKGGPAVVNNWGITRAYPENTPGAFPVHTPELTVCKDIEHWRDYVHAPKTDYSAEEFAQVKAMLYDSVDTTRAYKATLYVSGIFEMTHHLCSLEEALVNYIAYPDEMHDLIKYLTDYEMRVAEGICTYLQPEVIFHHDDWGTERNSFLEPAMFEDFFVDAYKQVYGYYHDHGVQFVIHHSDSYCANLVDSMIEMGIDVWQGCMHSNNVPELMKKYKGKIAFMGDIDNKSCDFPGWTNEDCRRAAVKAMEANGMEGFVPCITQGGPGSTVDGAYLALMDEVDKYNSEKFGFSVDELRAARIPTRLT